MIEPSVIVEFPNFTKAITTLMSDDEYRQLQVALVENPTYLPRWALLAVISAGTARIQGQEGDADDPRVELSCFIKE